MGCDECGKLCTCIYVDISILVKPMFQKDSSLSLPTYVLRTEIREFY